MFGVGACPGFEKWRHVKVNWALIGCMRPDIQRWTMILLCIYSLHNIITYVAALYAVIIGFEHNLSEVLHYVVIVVIASCDCRHTNQIAYKFEAYHWPHTIQCLRGDCNYEITINKVMKELCIIVRTTWPNKLAVIQNRWGKINTTVIDDIMRNRGQIYGADSVVICSKSKSTVMWWLITCVVEFSLRNSGVCAVIRPSSLKRWTPSQVAFDWQRGIQNIWTQMSLDVVPYTSL